MKTLRFWLLLSCLVAAGTTARAVTLIYPVEAIDDLWQLPADDFRQKYAGINISGIGPSDEGWYVRYKHENLTYMFGPLADSDAARKKKWELETVRDAAIRNRPTLSTSKVDFVKFTYSGVYGKGGGNSPYSVSGNARISKDGKSGPDGDIDGDGIPNAKDDDMDGDGIPNDKDGDVDGDGIPNEKDDYQFGAFPGRDGEGGIAKEGAGSGSGDGGGADGKGKGGKDGKDANGTGDKAGAGGKLAGVDGQGGEGTGGDGQGSGEGGKGGKKGGQGGKSSGGGDGGDGSDVLGGQQGGAQKVASAKGGKSGSSGGQQGGQSGQSGQQGGQSGSQGGSSGQAGGQAGGQSGGQQGQSGGSPGGPSGGGQGGGGNPLQLLGSLLKAILGL